MVLNLWQSYTLYNIWWRYTTPTTAVSLIWSFDTIAQGQFIMHSIHRVLRPARISSGSIVVHCVHDELSDEACCVFKHICWWHSNVSTHSSHRHAWCPSTVSSSKWTRLSCCGLDRGKVSLSKTDAFQYYIRGSMMMLYINIFYLLIETDNQMLVVTCSCRKCRPSTLRPRSAFTGISSSWRAEKLENPSSQTDNGRL